MVFCAEEHQLDL